MSACEKRGYHALEQTVVVSTEKGDVRHFKCADCPYEPPVEMNHLITAALSRDGSEEPNNSSPTTERNAE